MEGRLKKKVSGASGENPCLTMHWSINRNMRLPCLPCGMPSPSLAQPALAPVQIVGACGNEASASAHTNWCGSLNPRRLLVAYPNEAGDLPIVWQAQRCIDIHQLLRTFCSTCCNSFVRAAHFKQSDSIIQWSTQWLKKLRNGVNCPHPMFCM